MDAIARVTLTVNGETKDYYLSDVTTRGNYSPNGNDNYWQGANDVCTNKGMRLPTIYELEQLYTQKGQAGVPTSGGFWSASTFYRYGYWKAYDINFKTGSWSSSSEGGMLDVLCVGN